MRSLRELLERLLERRDLSESEVEELLTHLTNPEGPPAMAGAILAALRTKGVVADEVRGFANAMRRLARRPRTNRESCPLWYRGRIEPELCLQSQARK